MKRLTTMLGVLLLCSFALSGCGPAVSPTPAPAPGQEVTLEFSSSAFGPGEAIPQKYSCDGEDLSPPLQWGEPPEGTRGFALIMDDPDAGGFRHWVLYDLPAETRSLPEGIPADPEVAGGGRQGKNSWGKLGYGGPCPPSGTHRYSFRLYALDDALELATGAEVEQLYQAIQGHVLALVELVGTYTRSR